MEVKTLEEFFLQKYKELEDDIFEKNEIITDLNFKLMMKEEEISDLRRKLEEK